MRIRDPAAGRGDQRVARRDIPFAGGRKAGIDIDAALRDAAEFERGAEHLADCAGCLFADEGFGPAVQMRAADGTIQGSPRAIGWDAVWIGSASAITRLSAAPRPGPPGRARSTSAGAPTMPNIGVPFGDQAPD